MSMKKSLAWLAAAAALTAVSCNPDHQDGQATATPLNASSPEMKGWTTDLDKAFADAKAANKPVMLEFTGSTWCAQCITMTKNVFSKPEFIGEASKRVILVEIDVPFTGAAAKAEDPELAARNTAYAAKYGVEEFPQVVLFSPDGKEISRFFASDYPRTDLFLAQLDKELKKGKS